MWQPFAGAEAIGAGELTRGQLRWNHIAVHPGVYLPNGAERTLYLNTVAAWLWTARRGVIAGRAAAALHTAKWVDACTPIEVIAEHTRRRKGVIVHEERIGPHVITYVGELPVTTPARAAGVTSDDVTAMFEQYRGARGTRRARNALALMDAGAPSPEETRLRLLLVVAGLPAPRTQIRVSDGFSEAFIDMGYDEPMVGLDYEGSHHSENRSHYVYDLGRADLIDREGWIDIRVVKEHSRRYTLHRVHEAFVPRNWTPSNLHHGREFAARTAALVQNSTRA
jgi:hypothetical protein